MERQTQLDRMRDLPRGAGSQAVLLVQAPPRRGPLETGSLERCAGINTEGEHGTMATWTPDPTFYPSPRMAMKAPHETLAYVASFDPTRQVPDALAVVDVDPTSPSYGTIVSTVPMPQTGDELHHFGG